MRVYVRYERLYLAEFRALLRDIERAYNRVDSVAAESQRVRRHRRLTVHVIETGRSIETILIGSTTGLALLYHIATNVIKLRHAHWAAEEQKWKAKEQKTKAIEAERKLVVAGKDSKSDIDLQQLAEDPRLLRAEQILTDRMIKIQHSRTIESVEIEIGDPAELERKDQKAK
jgi:hypothetical protein